MESTKNYTTTSGSEESIEAEGLAKEIEYLRSENELLKGRLRGVETLGNLLQEAKDTNRQLEEQKLKLVQKLNESLTKQTQEKKLPASTNVITSISDIQRVYQPVNVITDVGQGQTKFQQQSSQVGNDIQVNQERSLEEIQRQFDQTLKTQSLIVQESEEVTKSSLLAVSPGVRSSTLNETNNEIPVENHRIIGKNQPIVNDQSTATELKTDMNVIGQGIEVTNTNDQQKLSELQYNDVNLPSFLSNWNMVTTGPTDFTVSSSSSADYNMASSSNNLESSSLNILSFIDQMKVMMSKIHQLQYHKEKFKKLVEVLTLENTRLKTELTQLKVSPNKPHFPQTISRSCSKESDDCINMKKSDVDRLHETILTLRKKLEDGPKQFIEKIGQLEQERDHLRFDLREKEKRQRDIESLLERAKQQVQQSTKTTCFDKTELSEALKQKDVEIAVLKQQINLCTEDFEKERQDRTATQAMKNSLEDEIRKGKTEQHRIQQQLRNRENQVVMLEEETRKLKQTNKTLRDKVASLTLRPQAQVAGISHIIGPSQVHPGSEPQLSNAFPVISTALEQMPGSWVCRKCTFINYPGRTVCEICGNITLNSQDRNDLTPRGPLNLQDTEVEIDGDQE